MGEHFKKVIKRMDIQQICEFVLSGEELFETDTRSYEQRVKEKDDLLHQQLELLFPNEKRRDDFYSCIAEALVIREQVYFELGMKANARILSQLLAQ